MGEGSMVRASAVVKATGSLRGGHPPQSHALALGLKSPSLSPRERGRGEGELGVNTVPAHLRSPTPLILHS